MKKDNSALVVSSVMPNVKRSDLQFIIDAAELLHTYASDLLQHNEQEETNHDDLPDNVVPLFKR